MKNRIYIFTQEQACKMCGGNRLGICDDCCAWEQMPNMTRNKAIERLSNGIEKSMRDLRFRGAVKNREKIYAQSALAALLESNNG